MVDVLVFSDMINDSKKSKNHKPEKEKLEQKFKNRQTESSLKLEFLSYFLESLSFVSSNKKPVFAPDELFFVQHLQIFLGNIKV